MRNGRLSVREAILSPLGQATSVVLRFCVMNPEAHRLKREPSTVLEQQVSISSRAAHVVEQLSDNATRN